MSRVDVIVPCYNYGHLLRSCVESVVTQEGVSVRVLIIDDASTDNSGEKALELAAQYEQVEVRLHKANRGHILTYNEGIEWASGDYVLLLSADDMLTPGALSRATRVMDNHPEVGLAYGKAYETENPEMGGAAVNEDYEVKHVPGSEFFETGCRAGYNLISTPTAVIRTRVQKEVGGYRTELPHTGDMEMWLRLALHTSFAYIDNYQAYYRLHKQNMHRSYSGAKDFLQSKLVFDILFHEYGARIKDRTRLARHAYRNLAQESFWSANKYLWSGDVVRCQDCIEIALQAWPGIRLWPPYWRYLVKRRLGRKLSNTLCATLNRLRGRTTLGKGLAHPVADGAVRDEACTVQ
jgi:glycosyltransferase involved in cell wall biosynthesis